MSDHVKPPHIIGLGAFVYEQTTALSNFRDWWLSQHIAEDNGEELYPLDQAAGEWDDSFARWKEDNLKRNR